MQCVHQPNVNNKDLIPISFQILLKLELQKAKQYGVE